MKTIAFEANGYDFEADIFEDTPLGAQAMSMPIDVVINSFVKSASHMNLNPDNIADANAGGSQIIFRIVS